MDIHTNVVLGPDDNFAYSPDAGAAQVLAALGGNPTTDASFLTVTQNAMGTAGTAPATAAAEAPVLPGP